MLCTYQQHHGLLERHGMPDLQLAVGPLKHALTEEQDKSGCLLNPLQHALLGEVSGPVVCEHAAVKLGWGAARYGLLQPSTHHTTP